jgi:hypothetical protein
MSKVSKNVVWSDPRAEECCGEEIGNSIDNDAYGKMSKHLAEIIAGIVTDSYGNRGIIKNLIFNAIVDQIRQYLREYDNVAAEDMLNSLKGWKLGEIKGWTSEVDFDSARHAKLSSFGDEVKELINKYKAENQLQRVREQILGLNPEPDSVTENNDGKIWLSNVLTIIDEELKPKFVPPGVKVMEMDKNDNPTPGVDIY